MTRLGRGEPLLFKLKSPVNMIVGGGFFHHYTNLPMSTAWDAFGRKNGAPSRDAVWNRIARLRRASAPQWYEDFTIGCILLVEPFFWPEELWIPQPADFSRNIVRGKGYSLATSPGRELWSAVLKRLQRRELVQGPAGAQEELQLPGGYSEPSPVRHRLGQGTFRLVVTDAYGRRCAVTREKALPALEAAHIKPFSTSAEHSVKNGLLLRSDVHRLFDSGYVTVTPSTASRRAGA